MDILIAGLLLLLSIAIVTGKPININIKHYHEYPPINEKLIQVPDQVKPPEPNDQRVMSMDPLLAALQDVMLGGAYTDGERTTD